MFPQQQIDGFEKYWRQRKPGSGTAVHYASIVYLSTTAAQLLNTYLIERPAQSEKHVFLNRRGKPITITGIQLQLAKYCRQADIWITCNQLRHTFACRMIAAGIPVTSVQKMLGHASIRSPESEMNVSYRSTCAR